MMIHLESMSINEDAIALIKWRVVKNSWGRKLNPSIEIMLTVQSGSMAEGEGHISAYYIYLEENSTDAKLLCQHYQRFNLLEETTV